MDSRGVGGDLVVVALPGVQRFLEEARSTSDVAAASGICSALAERVVDTLGAEVGVQLVLPVRHDPQAGTPGPGMPSPAEDSGPGLPSRIVALLPPGAGAEAALRASEACTRAWRGWVRQVMRPAREDPQTDGVAFLRGEPPDVPPYCRRRAVAILGP